LAQERVDYSEGVPPQDLGGKETSPRTDRQVSRVEEAKQKLQRQEASRRCDLATVTEEATNQEN
jgi:hypothetical protein